MFEPSRRYGEVAAHGTLRYADDPAAVRLVQVEHIRLISPGG